MEKILIKGEDGQEVEREFYTSEDIQKQIEERELAWKKEKEDLEQQVNPNWREAREKMKRLEALERKGKVIDDNGEIKEIETKLSEEEIINKASAKFKQEMINETVEDSLSHYNEEQKKVVKHFFEKLTAGEQLSIKNVENYLKQAESLAIPNYNDRVNRVITSGIGRVPSENNGKKNYADTDDGKKLASMLGLNI